MPGGLAYGHSLNRELHAATGPLSPRQTRGRIGATDLGTATLGFGHLCYLSEIRAPCDSGRRKFSPNEFPHPAISADAWTAGAA